MAVNDIAFIWCDMEGAETFVFENGAALWRAGIPVFAEVYFPAIEKILSRDSYDKCVRKHFSHFVRIEDLAGQQEKAPIFSMKAFGHVSKGRRRRRGCTDAPFLPPAFKERLV